MKEVINQLLGASSAISYELKSEPIQARFLNTVSELQSLFKNLESQQGDDKVYSFIRFNNRYDEC